MGKIFIVAGSHRSGTNLLCNALAGLPDTFQLNEVFQIHNTTSYIEEWRRPILSQCLHIAQFTDFCRGPFKWGPITVSSEQTNKVFRAILNHYSDCEKHLIIKILFQHCPYYYKIWDTIRNTANCQVIYIKRKVLDILVSAINASQSKVWYVPARTSMAPPEPQRVTVPPHRYLDLLCFLQAQYLYFDNIAKESPEKIYPVKYEDLATNWRKTTEPLIRWLGWTDQTMTPKSQRQLPCNHAELVDNLEDLREYAAFDCD